MMLIDVDKYYISMGYIDAILAFCIINPVEWSRSRYTLDSQYFHDSNIEPEIGDREGP